MPFNTLLKCFFVRLERAPPVMFYHPSYLASSSSDIFYWKLKEISMASPPPPRDWPQASGVPVSSGGRTALRGPLNTPHPSNPPPPSTPPPPASPSLTLPHILTQPHNPPPKHKKTGVRHHPTENSWNIYRLLYILCRNVLNSFAHYRIDVIKILQNFGKWSAQVSV